jgi:GMP synthase (glutamine-hydrolysing)
MGLPVKQYLIVKTGHAVAPLLQQGQDYEDLIIAGSGLSAEQFATVVVCDGGALPEPENYLGIYVTGSPAFVTDREPWSERTAEFLRQALARGVPVLGICYGHQLLAHSAGGTVGFHPGGREIGTVQVQLTPAGGGDALLGGLPATFSAQVSHRQSVLDLPGEALLLARNDFEPHQAFRLGDRAWGVQFHPEFSERVTALHIEALRERLLEEGLDSDRLLAQLRPTLPSSSLLRRFAELARQCC